MQIEAVATFKGWKLRLMGALFIIKVKILLLVHWSYKGEPTLEGTCMNGTDLDE